MILVARGRSRQEFVKPETARSDGIARAPCREQDDLVFPRESPFRSDPIFGVTFEDLCSKNVSSRRRRTAKLHPRYANRMRTDHSRISVHLANLAIARSSK